MLWLQRAPSLGLFHLDRNRTVDFEMGTKARRKTKALTVVGAIGHAQRNAYLIRLEQMLLHQRIGLGHAARSVLSFEEIRVRLANQPGPLSQAMRSGPPDELAATAVLELKIRPKSNVRPTTPENPAPPRLLMAQTGVMA
ncbi:hypothetical protein [Bradyrhizobium ivorense]|uniref:hypothetical protein n=1 Tax=Bradyrhizobium ivorense TaxID=2511166 RepID=UPI001117890B|nr:hypothetical protein [Bradyrhizobium ivorense]